MSNLTSRILAILGAAPITSFDIWDALGYESVRLADVRAELLALCDEGRVSIGEPSGLSRTYRLAAQAVAS